MANEVKGVAIIRLTNQHGDERGLLASTSTTLAGGVSMKTMVLLEGSDAEIGAAVRAFFAPAETEEG